ncbi:11677_t:CDS:2 [Entrophospora sp. SA101]|nr:11677_t:CDS:2 [Entrophospora sp. SA101]
MILKELQKKIKVADAELIANYPDIGPNEAELLQQIPMCKDDIQDWGMDHADWTILCDIDFVKNLIVLNLYNILEDLLISEDKVLMRLKP